MQDRWVYGRHLINKKNTTFIVYWHLSTAIYRTQLHTSLLFCVVTVWSRESLLWLASGVNRSLSFNWLKLTPQSITRGFKYCVYKYTQYKKCTFKENNIILTGTSNVTDKGRILQRRHPFFFSTSALALPEVHPAVSCDVRRYSMRNDVPTSVRKKDASVYVVYSFINS